MGTSGDYTWRYRLWNLLNPNPESPTVDFVGSLEQMANLLNAATGSSDYADCDFDWDHYALGGARLRHYLAVRPGHTDPVIREEAAVQNPDFVVAFVGVLDLDGWAEPDANNYTDPSEDEGATEQQIANAVAARAENFADQILSESPSAKVVLAKVPTTDHRTRFQKYNVLLDNLDAARSEIVVADMQDWQPPDHTWDYYHPDARGEIQIAADIADGLQEAGLGPGSVSIRPLNLDIPIGPRGTTVLNPVTFDSAVGLSWSLPTGRADNTLIERRDISEAGPWEVIANPGKVSTTPVTSYADNDVVPGGTYDYRVYAGKGTSIAMDLPSNVERITVPGNYVPAKPGPAFDARTIRKIRKINVDWSSVPSATSYDVRKRKGSGAWSTRNVAGDFASFGGLRACQAYSFQVRARNAGGASDWSTSLLAKPKGYVNAKLRKPSLKRRAGHKIRVGYQMRKSTATRYQIWIKQSGHGWKRYWDTKAPYVSKRLQKKKLYQVRVRAYDGCVAGKLSPIAKIRVG